MVPIMLAMLACGFGILANLHPKMEMSREPRGKIGKMIDQVRHQKFNCSEMTKKMLIFYELFSNAMFILNPGLPQVIFV